MAGDVSKDHRPAQRAVNRNRESGKGQKPGRGEMRPRGKIGLVGPAPAVILRRVFAHAAHPVCSTIVIFASCAFRACTGFGFF